VLNNEGTFNVTAGGDFAMNVPNAGHAINNSGTWNVSGAGTTSYVRSIAFNNTGAVNVTSGTFQLQGRDSGATTGSFAVSSGAVLEFGGNFILEAASIVEGAGNVRFASGEIGIRGAYNVTGTSSFAGATVYFQSGVTSLGTGPLVISSGAVHSTPRCLISVRWNSPAAPWTGVRRSA
jgi:hypothetical protein